MSETSHRPKTVADNLGISPATLRLWSNKFHPLLSGMAQKATTETGTSAQRRYTDTDVLIFTRAKQLLAAGKTYEETLAAITEEGTPNPEILADQVIEEAEEAQATEPASSSLVINAQAHFAILAMREALQAKEQTIVALQETVSSKDATIEALQTTVSANELHVQDLRSENERLRLDLEQRAAAPLPPAPAPEVTSSPQKRLSWWDRLLGRTEADGG